MYFKRAVASQAIWRPKEVTISNRMSNASRTINGRLSAANTSACFVSAQTDLRVTPANTANPRVLP
jgi:hypothetical protein